MLAIANDIYDCRLVLHPVQVFVNAVEHREQQLLRVLLHEPTEHSSVKIGKSASEMQRFKRMNRVALLVQAGAPCFSVRDHFISKEFKSLVYFALLAHWTVHTEFFFVKATKKKMGEFCSGKQALQRRVHVARSANVVQTEILWTPDKQSQMCDMRST